MAIRFNRESISRVADRRRRDSLSPVISVPHPAVATSVEHRWSRKHRFLTARVTRFDSALLSPRARSAQLNMRGIALVTNDSRTDAQDITGSLNHERNEDIIGSRGTDGSAKTLRADIFRFRGRAEQGEESSRMSRVEKGARLTPK